MKNEMNRRLESITECIGPPCLKPGIRRSMSGKTESMSNNGMFASVLSIFEVAFPVRYPRDEWPTANILNTPSSSIFVRYNVFSEVLIFDLACMHE